jgi:predicted nucleic acid-binding protein
MVENSGQKETNRRKLRSLIPQFSTWSYEEDEAREFGVLRVELSEQGTPIPIVDVMIAAVARANNLVVVSADRHFQVVGGLKVENWLE